MLLRGKLIDNKKGKQSLPLSSHGGVSDSRGLMRFRCSHGLPMPSESPDILVSYSRHDIDPHIDILLA
jgi:hypothetical protein